MRGATGAISHHSATIQRRQAISTPKKQKAPHEAGLFNPIDQTLVQAGLHFADGGLEEIGLDLAFGLLGQHGLGSGDGEIDGG
jgi:hypothetical protein